MISSKTPRKKTLEDYGYLPGKESGVYYSNQRILSTFPLISLNELSNQPHNSLIKCFASKKKEYKRAFNLLSEQETIIYSAETHEYFLELLRSFLKIQGGEMDAAIKEAREMGRKLDEFIFSHMRPEDRMLGLTPRERVAGLRPEERVAGLRPEERVAGLRPDKVLSMFKPDEIKSYLGKVNQE